MVRRIAARTGAVIAGTGSALWPLLALAEGEGTAEAVSRATSAPADSGMVMLIAVFALVGVFALGALGYAYRKQRGLDWAFQRPDAPHDAHH